MALAAHIRAELEANEDGEIREEHVLRELEAYLKPEEAERVLEIGIEWGRGRYGEVYEYVYNTGMLTLPREEREEREERETQEGGDNAQ